MDPSVFAAVFCALGLKLLFGNHSAGLGTLMLLSAVSAAGTVAIESFVGGKDVTHLANFSAEDVVDIAKRAWTAASQIVVGAPYADL